MSDMLASGVAASLGGGVSTLCLYPLDALRTKMASGGVSSSSAITVLMDTIRTQGLLGLFVGVSPKLMQSMLGKFLYFFFYTGLIGTLRNKTLASELFCGYLAEAMHLPLTIPLEVITTRIQKGGGNIADTLKALLREREGIMALWRGWRAYIFLCTQPMIQFIGFERLKNLWLHSSGAAGLTALESFILGALARAIAVCLTFPFTRARTILQARQSKPKSDDDAGAGKEETSIIPLLISLAKKDGLGSLYQGFYPELLRGVASSAVMLMIKEQLTEVSKSLVKAIL